MTKRIITFLIIIFLIGLSGCGKSNYLNDSYAVVSKGDTPYLINPSGETYSLAKYDEIIPVFGETMIVSSFKGGIRKYGFIKKNGQELIKPQYDMAYQFSDDKAVVKKSGKTQIISSKNKVLYTFPSNMTSISSYSEERLLVEIDGKYHFLDANYQLSPGYDYAQSFSNGYAIVGTYKDNIISYNYLTKEGTLLLADGTLDEYSYVGEYHEGYAKVGKSIQWDGWDNLIQQGLLCGNDRTMSAAFLSIYIRNGNVLAYFRNSLTNDNTQINLISLSFIKNLAYASPSNVFGDTPKENVAFYISDNDLCFYDTENPQNGGSLVFPKDFLKNLVEGEVINVAPAALGHIAFNLTKEVNPIVVRSSEEFVYSFIDETGKRLTDPISDGYYTTATNFNGGGAMIFISTPDSKTGYYYYYYVTPTGIRQVDCDGGGYRTKNGMKYFCGQPIDGFFRVKPFSAGAGEYKIAYIEETLIGVTMKYYLNVIDIVVPDYKHSNLSIFYGTPFEMTDLFKSPYYPDKMIARVHVYANDDNCYYGIINQDGEYITDAIYSQIFF